jgi:SecD/SecF fusion protein
MQNKWLVSFIAVLMIAVCGFYLSFSFVTSRCEKEIARVTETQGEEAGARYRDSLMSHPVYMTLMGGGYTLKECREMEVGYGLDLQGGMNVILEVSVPDVVKILADHKSDEAFNKAIKLASDESVKSQSDFISLFVKYYKQEAGSGKLAQIFATQQLRGKVNTNSSDSEVEHVLRDEVKAAIDNSYNVLRSRIDRFGVAQPNIQTLEGQMGRIMVEMPGVKEPDRVRSLLQGSANLEFWETYKTSEIVPYLSQLNTRLAAEASESSKKSVAPADTTATDSAAVAQGDSAKTKEKASTLLADIKQKQGDAEESADIEQIRKNNPLFARLQPAQGEYGCVVGFASHRDTAAVNEMLRSAAAKQILPRDLDLKWGVKGVGESTDVFELYAIKVTERNGRAPIEGDVIVDAKDEFDQQTNRPCVSMSMNSDGARRWAALTKANVDRAIAIVLDGYVYSAPTVHGEISGGNSQITGNFTLEDTKDLANVLKSGKMPAPARIVQEDIVGPSLGQQSINQGMWSFVVAFVLLIIYMCVMYGFRAGMVANVALILNLFFTLGVLASFKAALTMSGIAGLVLSLGMAVDANVLIYERTKEELRAGKNVKNALAAGYSNAFSAIADSNLTSIITGIILFNFGTGPIRGFATTLIIGIVVSFCTAVFLTRLVFEYMMAKDKWLNLTFTTSVSRNMMKNTNYHFMGVFKKSFSVFGVLALICIGSFVVRGLSRSIDFTGGRNFVVQFDEKVQKEDIDACLSQAFEGANVSAISLGDGTRVRVSTNYMIEDNSNDVDTKIETILYNNLKKGGFLKADVSLDKFINRDVQDGGSIISSQKVGPSIAEDITYGAIWSVLLALVAIFIYIMIRFRSAAFSTGAVVALVIDTLLIIGVYSLCWGWMPFSLEIDQTFIGAILTAIGYSINDKVVIFDRIREYIGLYPNRERQRLFNDSLNSTLARTINTSVSTLIVLLCIFILGGDSIRSFAFAMILGVVIGTCSSLFIAAPTAYLVLGRKIQDKNFSDEEEK